MKNNKINSTEFEKILPGMDKVNENLITKRE